MQRLRAAVIGAGYLGRFHAQKYAALPDVDLCAVVDLIEERALEVAAPSQAQALTDYRRILDVVDVASVVVPPESHYAVAKDCLAAGVHVLVEKPMTRTLAEADELIALARRQGLVLQVGHLERFNPALLALRGILHQPMFIESHRIASFQPRGAGVSVVMDLMIHDIDIILNIVASEVAAIRPMGLSVLTAEVDIANARLEFADGCVANVTASRVSHSPLRKIRIFQRDCYLSIDYLEHKVTIARRERDRASETGAMRIVTEEKNIERADALLLELQGFVHAVINKTPPVVSGEDGRRALAVALAITGAIEHRLPRPNACAGATEAV